MPNTGDFELEIFRPIISLYPAPTYQLAKRFSTLLTPFVPNHYSVTSSVEFLTAIKGHSREVVTTSLDVESIFTNVHRRLDPPLNISEPAHCTFLEICRNKGPFSNPCGHMYIQKDGVVKGSRLGVLLTNFYMGVVEDRVFAIVNQPEIYVRYINDTFAKAPSTECIDEVCSTFEECSSLRFMIEHQYNGRLSFLALTVERRFDTTFYTKPPNLDLCLNGNSECPTRYKTSTIRA
ncbi:uncharacterized protein [Palaemon carinicauda]|uniref:uncharacterized protein n=1 Tax=Palaemon carinicauda TaxID=392227 RepID=UPI0035B60FE3